MIAPITAAGVATAVPSVPVCAIQGSGQASPLVGQDVSTTGIVTAVDRNGVWIQLPACDSDPATSDGLFAFRGTGEVGDRVEVSGEVTEFFGLTQVIADQTTLTGQATAPPATVIDPAAARDPGYYETLEGMLVALERGQTYVGTNRFGETFLVPGSIDTRVRRTDAAPRVLALDDALPGAAPVHAFAFDVIEGAVGPLSFSFENYKLLVTEPPTVRRPPDSSGRPEPITAQPEGTLSVATWNLLEVFDEIDDGGPATPEPTPAEQARKRAKVARGIVDALRAPAVIAVQEVEKLPLLQAIATEADRYAAAQGLVTRYRAVLLEGNDERGIDVGFLLDESRVDIEDIRQLGAEAVSSGACEDGASGNLVYDRPPLAVDVRPVGAAPSARVTVVANHFKSKFGGTPENDFFEDCRVEQARVLRENVRGLPRVVLLGDFNAFRDSRSVAALTQGGYTNTVDAIPADRRFSFVFQGRVQFLDHLIVSPALRGRVEAVDSSKLDSDTPFPRFENDPSTGFATSDHDPLIAHLRLPH
jgi:predicted extracellular nuclease